MPSPQVWIVGLACGLRPALAPDAHLCSLDAVSCAVIIYLPIGVPHWKLNSWNCLQHLAWTRSHPSQEWVTEEQQGLGRAASLGAGSWGPSSLGSLVGESGQRAALASGSRQHSS